MQGKTCAAKTFGFKCLIVRNTALGRPVRAAVRLPQVREQLCRQGVAGRHGRYDGLIAMFHLRSWGKKAEMQKWKVHKGKQVWRNAREAPKQIPSRGPKNRG